MTSQLADHAVHRLYDYRKSLSTKPFLARGNKLQRCGRCLLAENYCTCSYCQKLSSRASFLLLMYDDEVLKPSNSGRLIADLIPDTHAFLWSRTQIATELLALLQDPHYQPLVIFPAEYALPNQSVINKVDNKVLDKAKRPLFIMLDGSWRQAVKMFRKSPYLHQFPLLSFAAGSQANYLLRKGQRDFQFATAEVAAMALESMGEYDNALALDTWFKLFVESSLLGRNRRSTKNLTTRTDIIAQFQALIKL